MYRIVHNPYWYHQSYTCQVNTQYTLIDLSPVDNDPAGTIRMMFDSLLIDIARWRTRHTNSLLAVMSTGPIHNNHVA